MVSVGLLVSEFQLRGPRDDIAKTSNSCISFWTNKVIFALSSFIFVFYVVKLSLKTFWNDLIVYSKHEI